MGIAGMAHSNEPDLIHIHSLVFEIFQRSHAGQTQFHFTADQESGVFRGSGCGFGSHPDTGNIVVDDGRKTGAQKIVGACRAAGSKRQKLHGRCRSRTE